MFSLSDGDVFYVGKTEAQRGDFARIWKHTRTAGDLPSGVRGFPDAVFRSNPNLAPAEHEAIEKGLFWIDYLVVTPPQATSLFEVYLQTVCFLTDKRLPSCNVFQAGLVRARGRPECRTKLQVS